MADMPFFKFYHQDWLAGTGGLSAVEKGVYITLLALMYDMGGKIRRDDSRLAMRCGARVNHFKAALQVLIDEGKIVEEDGYISNTRVEKERVVYHDLCEKNSSNAARRWNKTEQKQQPENATASISQCQNDAIQKSEVRSQIEIDKSISLPASPKPKRAKPRTSMTEDRQPSDKDRAVATEAGMTDAQFRQEWGQFRNYHLQRGNLMADWEAAWRTWVGNFAKFASARSGSGGALPRKFSFEFASHGTTIRR